MVPAGVNLGSRAMVCHPVFPAAGFWTMDQHVNAAWHWRLRLLFSLFFLVDQYIAWKDWRDFLDIWSTIFTVITIQSFSFVRYSQILYAIQSLALTDNALDHRDFCVGRKKIALFSFWCLLCNAINALNVITYPLLCSSVAIHANHSKKRKKKNTWKTLSCLMLYRMLSISI